MYHLHAGVTGMFDRSLTSERGRYLADGGVMGSVSGMIKEKEAWRIPCTVHVTTHTIFLSRFIRGFRVPGTAPRPLTRLIRDMASKTCKYCTRIEWFLELPIPERLAVAFTAIYFLTVPR
jgi:hypothetical protein